MTEQEEALDPSTPPARLVELMESELEAVLQNASLPLILVEHPDFWSALAEEVLEDLATMKPCPSAFVEWVRTTRGAAPRLDVLENDTVPAEARREVFFALPLETDWDPMFGVMDDFLSPDEAVLLFRAAGYPEPPSVLTEAELVHLATLGGMGLELAVKQPACPPSVLEAAFRHPLGQAHILLLRHPRLPAACLAEALASAGPGFVSQALQNPSLTAEQFHVAATDSTRQRFVALNPALPVEWVERFAASPDAVLRAEVARNESCPPAVQRQLAADESAGVRTRLRHNPKVTPEALQILHEMDAKT